MFAWVTSRDVLARFYRDAKAVGIPLIQDGAEWQPLGPPNDNTACVSPAGDCDVTAIAGGNEQLVLEEFAFQVTTDPVAREETKRIAQWLAANALFPQDPEYKYWREKLPKSLAILPENAFRDFTQFSTEVINRIKLKEDGSKTVEKGALWSEEHLPSDTLLYAPLFASRPRVEDKDLPSGWQSVPVNQRAAKILEYVKTLADSKRLQLGGDETVGRGVVKARIVCP